MADIVVQFRGTVYENGYGQIAQKVMRDKSIHAIAKAIYAYLVSFAGQDGSAFPSVQLMMDELGIKSEDTFYKYRKQLIEAGYITIEQQQRIKGQFYNNVYIIEVIPHPNLSSTAESSTTKLGTTSISSLQVSDLQQYHLKITTTDSEPFEEGAATTETTNENMHEQNKDAVVVELKDLFETWTGQVIKTNKMRSLIAQYGVERVTEGVQIILQMDKWDSGAEGALCAALRDNWKLAQRIINQNKLVHGHSNADANNKRDERYSAFYEIFPDA